MEALILAGLILLNGAFAMSEIAVVTAKKSRLLALADKGSKRARAAAALAEEPTQFLSTVQIGITSIGIMNGIFGESVFAQPFAVWLQSLGVSSELASPTATVLVVVVVTYLSIVVGELVPKRIGQLSAEGIACAVARPMQWLAIIAKPFVNFLSWSTRLMLVVLRIKEREGQNVTEEDIQAMLSEGSTTGIIEEHEHTMVKNVFRFDERPIFSLMVPRSDVIFLDINLPQENNFERVMASPHNNFPICDGGVDNLIGVVSSKDLFAHAISNTVTSTTVTSNTALDFTAFAKPCLFVPPGLKALQMLHTFHRTDTNIAFIVDEYGDFKGLITLYDLMEALTGDLDDKDEDAFIIRRADGSYLLDGLLPIIDFKDLLGLSELPGEGEYHTLNGLVMQIMDKIPSAGDTLTIEPWQLEIVDMDGRRIDKLIATRQAVDVIDSEE